MLNFKYFDPRLVLDFEPEWTELDVEYEVEQFLFVSGQYLDYIAAIEYAENVIIPKLLAHKKSNFSELTPEEFIGWIKDIHRRIAKTLASQHGLTAGEHPPKTIIRWHKTTDMNSALSIAIHENADCAPIFKHYGLAGLDKPFFAILDRVFSDPSIQEEERNRPIVKATRDRILQAMAKLPTKKKEAVLRNILHDRKMHKLADAKHQGKLSAEDLHILNQIIQICLAPEQMPDLLLEFAKEFIEKLKTCDGQIDSLSTLFAYLFQKLTFLHVFFNGNGRTALIDGNIFLAVFEKKTIILRERNEKSDPTSLYSRAVNSADNDLTLLQQLFKLRMAASQNQVETLSDWQQHVVVKKKIAFAQELIKLANMGTPLQMLQVLYKAKIQQVMTLPPATDYPGIVQNLSALSLEPKKEKELVFSDVKAQGNISANEAKPPSAEAKKKTKRSNKR